MAYIVVFTVKKRIILRVPWQERKGTISQVTSGISRTDVINENFYSSFRKIGGDGFSGFMRPGDAMV